MTKTRNRTETTPRQTADRRPGHAIRKQRDIHEQVERRLAELEPDVELLAVELAPGRGGTLRIFLDAPGGVTLEHCTRVTRHLGDLLAEYSVEVSSPGPSRPLSKPEHFRRFAGQRVRVRTVEPVEGHDDFKAELVGADADAVTLAAAWGTVTVPYGQIRKTNLIARTGRKQ